MQVFFLHVLVLTIKNMLYNINNTESKKYE